MIHRLSNLCKAYLTSVLLRTSTTPATFLINYLYLASSRKKLIPKKTAIILRYAKQSLLSLANPVNNNILPFYPAQI
jgi:hypothetical protein